MSELSLATETETLTSPPSDVEIVTSPILPQNRSQPSGPVIMTTCFLLLAMVFHATSMNMAKNQKKKNWLINSCNAQTRCAFQEKFEGLLEAAHKERTEDLCQTGYEHPWSEAEEEATQLVEEADDYAKMKKVSLFRFF